MSFRPRLALVAILLAGAAVALSPIPSGAAPSLLSQGKPATASSTENAGTPASAAVDGNAGTRWSSAFSDPQWLQVDLGAPSTLTRTYPTRKPAYSTGFPAPAAA